MYTGGKKKEEFSRMNKKFSTQNMTAHGYLHFELNITHDYINTLHKKIFNKNIILTLISNILQFFYTFFCLVFFCLNKIGYTKIKNYSLHSTRTLPL